jgi:hypothetical protein
MPAMEITIKAAMAARENLQEQCFFINMQEMKVARTIESVRQKCQNPSIKILLIIEKSVLMFIYTCKKQR